MFARKVLYSVDMPLVFQYGSNCDAERLNSPERLGGAAVDRGLARTVQEYDIGFDVRSQINQCAASDLVKAEGTGRAGLWPSAEYVSHIVAGLRAHECPERYVRHVTDVAAQSCTNADNEAAAKQRAMIEALRMRISPK